MLKTYVKMMNMLKNHKGQGVVEYTIILAAVVVVALVIYVSFKQAIKPKVEGLMALL